MSKKNAEKKELELRQQKAETEKAELDLATARLHAAVTERDFKYSFETASEATGTFRFSSEVVGSTCAGFASRVRRYAQLNPGAPITIVLNTPGGSVIAGLGLFDELRAIAEDGHHITTKVRGYAASMGAVARAASGPPPVCTAR